MSSGVFFDEDYLSFNSDINKMGRVLAIGGSMDEFAAGLSRTERASGEVRNYVSIDTHVIGMVLRRATGKSVLEYLNENLWSKMGVKESIYYVTDEQGVAFVLGGLNMRTRDYARFGQLFLQDGQWLGQQVLPKEWVRASTANSAPASLTDEQGYGYQWWLPEQADEEFFAIGIYGQYIYVNRKLNVVIAKNSAHREFRDDGKEGFVIKNTTIEAFRAMAGHYAKP
jgi:CubicO group peptidase (beta-lactamase class C family)